MQECSEREPTITRAPELRDPDLSLHRRGEPFQPGEIPCRVSSVSPRTTTATSRPWQVIESHMQLFQPHRWLDIIGLNAPIRIPCQGNEVSINHVDGVLSSIREVLRGLMLRSTKLAILLLVRPLAGGKAFLYGRSIV